MTRTSTLASLALLFLATPLAAQISFGGQPYGDKAEKRGMPPAVVVDFPALDHDRLIAEDEARYASGVKGPFRFGFEQPANLTLENSGSWSIMPNGDRVWRLMLHCPGALSINLQWSEYVIPDGARMFIYNEAGLVRGGFTAKSNPGHTAFGTAPLAGDRITVEYVEPQELAGQGRLTINNVIHGYRSIGLGEKGGADRDFGDSGPCNVNTICPEGDHWRAEIRSVARIMLGGGLCSGTLLNNCANDSTPYFLTARHCTVGNESTGSWVFLFNWESPVCEPTENAPMDHTITGCDKLLEWQGTDGAFLRLSSVPPAAFEPYFSGWDASGISPDTIVGIHHPRGDIKKICSSYGPITQDNINAGSGDADCWHAPQWDIGTTEQGSSGSAIWDQDHRVIGQLYGGQASCSNNVNDYYGRFDLLYPHISEWLGECGDTMDGFDPDAFVPVPLDAAITSISSVPRVNCTTDSIRPVVTLKNNGQGPITYANIQYAIDGVNMGVMPWFGVIQPVQTTNVTLPAIGLPNGVFQLKVTVADPNHGMDTEPINNSDSLVFMVNNPVIMSVVQMNLDRYGTETRWKIETQDGYLAYQGGPYTNSANGYTVNTQVCLSHDCYVFTIMDAIGDGMCCNYGEGSYMISDTLGNVLLDGNGAFGFEASTTFCVDWVGVQERVANGSILVAPNPSNGQFTAFLPELHGQWQLRAQDALGRIVWSGTMPAGMDHLTMDFSHLARGTYILVAEGEGQRAVQRVVIQP
ncbi:MAG TPA: T9SS type A sorting domain-containing protein [Flavobacteriales bacterium]|nr:T9SS type A sorting domain-containing protein [Flavobacteriales bacterium]